MTSDSHSDSGDARKTRTSRPNCSASRWTTRKRRPSFLSAAASSRSAHEPAAEARLSILEWQVGVTEFDRTSTWQAGAPPPGLLLQEQGITRLALRNAPNMGPSKRALPTPHTQTPLEYVGSHGSPGPAVCHELSPVLWLALAKHSNDLIQDMEGRWRPWGAAAGCLCSGSTRLCRHVRVAVPASTQGSHTQRPPCPSPRPCASHHRIRLSNLIFCISFTFLSIMKYVPDRNTALEMEHRLLLGAQGRRTDHCGTNTLAMAPFGGP